jgi:hypothetical protein
MDHGTAQKEFLTFSTVNRRSNDVTAQSAAILSWLRQRDSEMAALLGTLSRSQRKILRVKTIALVLIFWSPTCGKWVLIVIAWDRALRETTPRMLLRVCSRPTAVENAPSEMCPGLLAIRFYAVLGMPAFAYGPGFALRGARPKRICRLRRIVETTYLALLWVLT